MLNPRMQACIVRNVSDTNWILPLFTVFTIELDWKRRKMCPFYFVLNILTYTEQQISVVYAYWINGVKLLTLKGTRKCRQICSKCLGDIWKYFEIFCLIAYTAQSIKLHKIIGNQCSIILPPKKFLGVIAGWADLQVVLVSYGFRWILGVFLICLFVSVFTSITGFLFWAEFTVMFHISILILRKQNVKK